ncbi:D-glycero-beta-D-manno-heptose 1-phosphate adenylyltransferase [Plantactinospora alkalitolerans]|uniref:D-glycero-beta-D-manno-heptose 1-phosphate adenylyltransferase n=1 Tax=Plantactinospora alkalitolerans TaxID=2789879 RepID=UPI001E446184|nr:D-glycero-beta-D-manno-heptose 1-phosphate adenylyltransferase [Plantactinospora alkalitolerans]
MATDAAEQRRLAAVVESWLGRGVLVVGDAMLDEWRFAESDRLCREAPAPVLTLRRRLCAAGGAANTAVNLTALGGRATLVAPVGADVAGDELHDCLDRAGVWDRTISQPGRPTPVKRRLLAADQILVREDEGDADETLPEDGVRRMLSALAHATEELRAEQDGQPPTLVVCDYGLGALPEAVRGWLVEHRDHFATVALDAHDLAHWRGLAPTVVTPSFAEATRLLSGPNPGGNRIRRSSAVAGTRISVDEDGTTSSIGGREVHASAGNGDENGDPGGDRTGPAVSDGGTSGTDGGPGGDGISVTSDEIGVAGDDIVVAGDERSSAAGGRPVADGGVSRAVVAQARLAELRERTGADVVAVTLDTEGAVVGGADGRSRRSHATPVPASYAVGAGDAYLAAMTLALAAEAPLPTAAQLAQLAATTTVSDTGTCVCLREDLLAALGPVDEERPRIVLDQDALIELVARRRAEGRSIVFTNGCFDVLHRGHVRYLDQARGLGDLLVVAVNSDDSVRRVKGTDRPVNPVEDRVAVLAALSCVDHVVIFEEDSPSALIEAVRPDLYVKGGDYPPEMVPEAPLVRRLGGEVRTLGYVPDRSTSAVIERIRSHGDDRRPALPGDTSNTGDTSTNSANSTNSATSANSNTGDTSTNSANSDNSDTGGSTADAEAVPAPSRRA